MGVNAVDSAISDKRRRLLKSAAAWAALAVVAQRALGAAAVSRARVVVAGGGFAGAACALALRRLAPDIDITLVDPEARYVTGPLSNTALVGWRTMDSITVSRTGLERAGVRLVRDRVSGIDAGARNVRLAGGTTLGYDRLVVAPGIRFLWNTPEGYDEAAQARMPHAWIPGAQTELLGAQLRAMEDGGVFAISVPGGLMRCPPAPFERATVVAAWLKQHKPRSKVLVFDANNHFPRQAIFEDAWKTRYPGMVEWVPSTEGGVVARVDPAKMILHTGHGAQRVAVANVIPPQAAGTLALEAGLAAGHGWCPVHPLTFESTLLPHVHAIGDACAAGAMPKAASAARSQAEQCAHAITALLAGREPSAHELQTACYSFLARDGALAIHGRFVVEDDAIAALPLPSPTVAPSAHDEARLAERWYTRLLADSFGV